MASRIGFYTLRKVGEALCMYIVRFTPAIQTAYPNNAALLAALAAANAACHALTSEIIAVQEPGV